MDKIVFFFALNVSIPGGGGDSPIKMTGKLVLPFRG